MQLFARFCSAKLTWYTSSDSFRAFFWQNLRANDEDYLPKIGKYNAGQKFVFWSQFILIGKLFVTGVGLCEQGLGYFENLLGFKATIEQKRWTVLTHVSAAVLAITTWIIHVYAVIWVRGTISAMTRGTVTGGCGWRHHRKWLRKEVARGEVEKVA
jgi:formate dehydrogenase subunit gamma